MLSKEDSRRLAQLERQLRREDPEFCARMTDGPPETTTGRRLPLSLILTAAIIWIAALVLGALGWWIAAAVAALWATIAVAVLAYRFTRRRGHAHKTDDLDHP